MWRIQETSRRGRVTDEQSVGRDQVPAGARGADGRWCNVLRLGTKQEEQVQGLGLYLCTEAPQKGAPSVWATVKTTLNAHT